MFGGKSASKPTGKQQQAPSTVAIPAAFQKAAAKSKPPATATPFKSTPALAPPPPAKTATSGPRKRCFGVALLPIIVVCCFLLAVIAVIVVFAVMHYAEPVKGSIYFAQTHVIPPEGLSWPNTGGRTLKLVGKREALFMFTWTPRENGTFDPLFVLGYSPTGAYLGSVPVSSPEDLPKVEDNQTFAFSDEHYSATLPAAWIVPNFGLAVSDTASTNAGSKSPILHFSEVGADSEVDLWILPMYFYGANETNSYSLEQASIIPQRNYDELWAKLPISKLNVKPHPLGKLQFDFAITSPRNNGPSFVLTDRSQEGDGYQSMSIVLQLLMKIRSVNGYHNAQMYSPMMTLSNGRSVGPGGGLGGGNTATGDVSFTGIFIHEVGHGFGLPHAGGAYESGNYPYTGGSLRGSQWGYDSKRRIFLPNTLPPSAGPYRNCKENGSRQKLPSGECVKQDYMQGGAGDQARGDVYTMNSDFNAAVIQAWSSGITYVDSNSPTGYSRWSNVNKTRLPVQPITNGRGQGGLDAGIPYRSNVLVYTVICVYSFATPEVNRFYPMRKPYMGNLMRMPDPTNNASLHEISVRGPAPWFCVNSGCDFTFRMTYQDGTVQHQLIQQSSRVFNNQGTWQESRTNPNSGSSFLLLAANFPADKLARRIDLLETPQPVLNNGIGAGRVLLSFNF